MYFVHICVVLSLCMKIVMTVVLKDRIFISYLQSNEKIELSSKTYA